MRTFPNRISSNCRETPLGIHYIPSEFILARLGTLSCKLPLIELSFKLSYHGYASKKPGSMQGGGPPILMHRGEAPPPFLPRSRWHPPPLFATSSTRGFLKQFLKGRLQKQIEESVAAPHIHLESRKGKGSSSSLLVGHRQKVVQNTL